MSPPTHVVVAPSGTSAPTVAAPPPELEMSAMEPAEVVRRHGAYVGRVVRYLGVAETDIADACQEVFVVVLRRIDSVQSEARIQSWLYGICLRVASNYRRGIRRRREVSSEMLPEWPTEPTQHRDVQRMQARALLLRLLDELDEAKRAVFVMHEIEQLPMPAVAKLLGIPLGTGYSRLRAARQQLKRATAGLAEWRSDG